MTTEPIVKIKDGFHIHLKLEYGAVSKEVPAIPKHAFLLGLAAAKVCADDKGLIATDRKGCIAPPNAEDDEHEVEMKRVRSLLFQLKKGDEVTLTWKFEPKGTRRDVVFMESAAEPSFENEKWKVHSIATDALGYPFVTFRPV